MNSRKDAVLQGSIQGMAENYSASGLLSENCVRDLPNRPAVLEVLHGLRDLLFPGYFTDTPLALSLIHISPLNF